MSTPILNRSLIVFAFIISIQILAAQEIGKFYLKGVLNDTVNNTTINNVNISIENNGLIISSTTSNKSGEFLFENLTPGNYSLKIQHFDYKPKYIDIEISEDIERFIISLNRSNFLLNTFEIIGKSKEDLSILVGAGSKIENKKISRISPIGTQELLEFVPGIFGFSDDGVGNSRISIGIRGINPRRASRTLVLEDGIPVQPALYIYSNMYYNPPVEKIDHIEILKGGSSIQFGPQTMGGVINYRTKRPRESIGGRVNINGGNNNYFSSLVEFGGFGNSKFRPEVQLIYKRGDGFRENNDFEQFNGSFKMLFVPSEKRNIYVNLNANSETSNATYTGLTEYSFNNNYNFNPKNNDMFYVNRYSANIIQQRKINTNWESTTKGYFNFFKRDWWREYDIFTTAEDYVDGDFTEIELENSTGIDDLIRVGGGESNFGILRTFSVAGIDQQYLHKHKINDTIYGSLKVGGRFHFERFKDHAGNGDSPDARTGYYYRANNYETYAHSYFIREDLHIGDFLISPGVRFELFEQEMVNLLNDNRYDDAIIFEILPGLGFNFKLNKINFYGGIHKGMTPPSNGTLLTLDFGRTDGTDFENMDLKSETSVITELGARTNQKFISADLTFFHLSIKDMISAARGTQFTNLDNVSSSGTELGLELKLSSYKSILPNIFTSYTFLETEINDGILRSSALNDSIIPNVSGNQLPYAPRHNLIIGISSNYKSKLFFMVNYKYISECFSDFENITFTENRGDTGPIPSYWLLNCSVGYRANSKVNITLSGKNLLDKKYIGSRLHSNPRQRWASSSSGILPGLGRQINLVLSFNF